MPGPGTGHRSFSQPETQAPPAGSINASLSDLDVGELARDVRWHVGAANADTRREALLLVPPATALNRREKPQMLSVSEDAHGELPESDYRQEQTQFARLRQRNRNDEMYFAQILRQHLCGVAR